VAAAAYIERIGGRRRRGTGKCKISLEDHNLHNEILNSFENRHFRETHQISSRWKESLIVKDVTHNITSHHNASHRYRIMLYTERPVVIAEKPEAGNVYQGQIVIPGSTLRGALANLARPEVLRGADAAMYAEFKRFFVHGELKLSHLNPIEVSNGLGTPVAQIPMGLQQIEGSPDCCFTSVFQQLSKEKSFSGWIRLQNGLQKATYNTEPHPHVRINPDLKRASDGDLYTYEAIPAGRFYGGELYLKDNDWKSIGELLRVNINEPFELQIGKGRNRSYGQVRAVIVPMTEDEPPAWIHVPLEVRLKMTPANVLYITLATDSILQDQWGRFYGRFEEKWLAAELEAPDVQIMVAANDERPDQVVRTRLIESFDARSGLPRWRDKALLAGSTACLVFADGKRPSLDILKRLETTGVGVRRDEGFGRVIFNHPAHTGNWSGFANAIAIPQKLLDSVPAAPVEETQQAFDQRWKEKISRSIRGTVSEPICRSLAIQMMEYLPSNHSTDQQAHHSAVESLIESLKVKQVATDQSQKALYQEYKTAVDTITKLLEEIKNEQQHWRKAVILLAEALMNNREKA
jgi:CRISPR-associated protein Csx10